jgi:hypothetical protein
MHTLRLLIMPTVISLLLFLLVGIVLWLNAKASLAILRDSFSTPKQRTLQIIIVWFVPLIGALAVLGVHRPTEKSPGRYPEETPPPDEFHGRKRDSQDIEDS